MSEIKALMILVGIWSMALAVSLTLAFVCWMSLVCGLKSNHWPSVQGKVNKVWDASIGTRGARQLQIDFIYEVNGHAYTGRRISYRFASAEANLPLGQGTDVVLVYHDPNDPKHSVLVPGVDWLNWVASFIPAGLLSVLSVLGISFVRDASFRSNLLCYIQGRPLNN